MQQNLKMMKNTLLVLLTFICQNILFAQTDLQITDAYTSIPTEEYLELLVSRIELPTEITNKINSTEIEVLLALTILKDGAVFNPSIHNDSLGLRPYFKDAFTDLPKWHPKTEDGIPVVSKKAFKLIIPIQQPVNYQAINSAAKPQEGVEKAYHHIAQKLNVGNKDYNNADIRVKFIVEKDGSLTNIQIVSSNTPSLNAEVIRVIKSMPKWNPATKDGVPVRSKFTMPIKIRQY